MPANPTLHDPRLPSGNGNGQDVASIIRGIIHEELASAMKTSGGPLLVTQRRAAELLAVCPKTIQNLTKRGQLKAVPIGTAGVRYDVADLRVFIEQAKA